MAFSASVIFKGIDAITGPVKRMQASTQAFATSTIGSFERVSAGSSMLAVKMESLSSKMLSFKSILVGGMAFMAVKKMYEFTTSTIEASHQQELFSKRMNMSVQSTMGLLYAGQKAGLGTEQVMKSFARFNIQMGKLQMNTGNLSKFLMSNDIVLLSKLKHTKDTSKAFDLFADSVARVHNPMLRATMIASAFGARAGAIGSLMDKGSAGIKQAKERYLELAGNVGISTEKLAELRSVQVDMNTALDGTKRAIGAALVPAFIEIFKATTLWLSSNRDIIASKVKEWVEDFAGVVKFLANHITLVTRAIGFYIGATIALNVATLACKIVTIVATAATWALTLATDMASIAQNGLILATLNGTAALKIVTAWIWLTSAATWEWAAALWATGIPEIVIGILALGTAIYFTIKYWDEITDTINNWANSSNIALASVGIILKSLTDSVSSFGSMWKNVFSTFSDGGFLEGLKRISNYIVANIIEPFKELLHLIGMVPGFSIAEGGSKGLQKYQDQITGNEKPVNKDASILTQKKILETNSSQNVQINIDDATGRARLGGNTAPIPVFINNTKGFEWYGPKNN